MQKSESRWTTLAANCTPKVETGTVLELPLQFKIRRNKKKPPSRRSISKGKKRNKPKQAAKIVENKASLSGRAFTSDAQKALQVLIPWLRESKVVRGPISANGSQAKALAAAFFVEIDEPSSDPLTRENARFLFGARRDYFDMARERLRAAGGATAILAQAALAQAAQDDSSSAPENETRWDGSDMSRSKAERCRNAMSYIARGGVQLRASLMPPPNEYTQTRSTATAAAPPEPLRPQPLREADRSGRFSSMTNPMPPMLAADIMPDGSRHCGGDLLFPLLTLVRGDFRARMPLFVMKSGAIALFSGSDLMHGTTEHHGRKLRARGCKAHVSFAVQTPAPVLGGSRGSDRVRELHRKLMGLGGEDAAAADGNWADAVHLAVQHTPDGPTPQVKLSYNPEVMVALPYVKVVLYDVETGSPLVMYDASGGLTGKDATRARKCFGFLDDYSFTLKRDEGALGIDPGGEQRMLMLGIRDQVYGNPRPDASKQRQKEVSLTVANRSGDLDGYVAHWDEPELRAGAAEVRATWEAISARLNALLPRAFGHLSQALAAARVRERLYCADASNLLSEDGIVNNVGASAAYQSPAHADPNDVSWTAAVSVKCC